MGHHQQPFTQEELTLIEVANQIGTFMGDHHHHHHHHHEHVQFKAPQKITTGLGLYALKKLNAINPNFLSFHQARLLEPVTPGPLTHYTSFAFYVASAFVGVNLWRAKGLKGFASLSVLPLVAIIGAKHITMNGINYFRQSTYSLQRRALVQDYVSKYGEQFMINVLNPSFRLL